MNNGQVLRFMMDAFLSAELIKAETQSTPVMFNLSLLLLFHYYYAGQAAAVHRSYRCQTLRVREGVGRPHFSGAKGCTLTMHGDSI